MGKKHGKVLVTGGAGYVGSALVPRMIREGYDVNVLDLYLYGDDVLSEVKGAPGLTEIRGDIRDRDLLERAVKGCDTVIHLACISNDPSYDLDPALGKAINYDAFLGLVDAAKKAGVARFIYASSSSVYGIKETPEVTEDMPLSPLTDYSKYKALCEEVLLNEGNDRFVPLIFRPSTVCGYAPRLRLDVVVNILTSHAFHNRKVRVFGGEQLRPNLHISDMVEAYMQSLTWADKEIKNKIYNVGYMNHKVRELGEMVRDTVGKAVGEEIDLEVVPSDDNRSYHVSSEKIRRELGFTPKYTIIDAVNSLVAAFQAGRVPGAMTDPRYINIKKMQALNFK